MQTDLKNSTISYKSHKENEDGTSLVSFRKPLHGGTDIYKVLRPVTNDFKSVSSFFSWLRGEKILEYLTKKHLYDVEFDKSNNIKRCQSIGLGALTFKFDYFDGVVNIYGGSYGILNSFS